MFTGEQVLLFLRPVICLLLQLQLIMVIPEFLEGGRTIIVLLLITLMENLDFQKCVPPMFRKYYNNQFKFKFQQLLL